MRPSGHRALVHEEEKRQIQSLVHDTVLAVLTLAVQSHSPEQATMVRHFAASAIVELREGLDNTLARGSQQAGARELEQLLGEIAVLNRIIRPPIPGSLRELAIPVDSLKALTQAAGEAMRNSVLHALAPATVKVRAVPLNPQAGPTADGLRFGVEVEISDDGPGFDPSATSEERLGIRTSMVARMRDAGGQAVVMSAPGAGTTVLLMWPHLDVGSRPANSAAVRRQRSRRQCARQRARISSREQARSEWLPTLEGHALPLLRRLTESCGPEEQAAAKLLEGELRDSIRGRFLSTSDLRTIARRARSRGLRFELIDDRGTALPEDVLTLTRVELLAVVDNPSTTAVRVRAWPQGRACMVSIWFASGGREVQETLLEIDDPAVEAAQDQARA